MNVHHLLAYFFEESRKQFRFLKKEPRILSSGRDGHA